MLPEALGILELEQNGALLEKKRERKKWLLVGGQVRVLGSRKELVYSEGMVEKSLAKNYAVQTGLRETRRRR